MATILPHGGVDRVRHICAHLQPHLLSGRENHSDEVFIPKLSGTAVDSMEKYRAIYQRSLDDNDGFWDEQARTLINWSKPFNSIRIGDFGTGHVAWFAGGKLNASYNCVDRHVLNGRADKVALLWEGDEPGEVRKITFRELLHEVCRMANALRRIGVKKGDGVCIYAPVTPETVFTILAVVRIGAFHNVCFPGFSADAIRDRILDSNNHYIFTSDQLKRGGKLIPAKETIDAVISMLPPDQIRQVVVLQRTGNRTFMLPGRDVYYSDIIQNERPYCPPEEMDAEDTLFVLYTSGSTGKPKGLQHVIGGYLVHAALSTKLLFDLREDDVYWCGADIAWVTGHTYVMYGPLLNGITTVLFESTPVYPDPGRFWDVIARHRITQFYTSPTAVRTLMKFGDEPVWKYDRSSIRVFGSVGEPINSEAWRWLYTVVGEERVPIVDTYWQTETGGIMISGLPGCTPMKPGSASLPFFGIEPEILTPEGKVLEGNDVKGVLAIKRPWPGLARTILKDHPRYLRSYLNVYKNYYFTGDGAMRDKDGYIWITGRVDDVVNVSGHRIGSAEIEAGIGLHPHVAESACIGIHHDTKGQSLFAFVILKNGFHRSSQLVKELEQKVRDHVGSFAKPDDIVIVPGLPKTRSGKIMRRMLRKIAEGATDPTECGDATTLLDPEILSVLIKEVAVQRTTKKPQRT